MNTERELQSVSMDNLTLRCVLSSLKISFSLKISLSFNKFKLCLIKFNQV